MSRFLVFLVLPTTPIIFGLSVYTFLIDAPGNPLTDQVIRWLGLAYGVAAILTALGEAWLVVRRRALPYRGPEFTRVLVLAVIPETVVLFTLIVAIQAASFIIRGPTEPGLSPQEGEALIRACQFMMFGSVSATLAKVLRMGGSSSSQVLGSPSNSAHAREVPRTEAVLEGLASRGGGRDPGVPRTNPGPATDDGPPLAEKA